MDLEIKRSDGPMCGIHFRRMCLNKLAQSIVLLLFCSTTSQGAHIIADNKAVKLGDDVVLACKLLDTIDKVLRVDWTRTTENGPKQDIFAITISRPPIYEDVSGLKDRLQFMGSIEHRIGDIQLQNAQIKDNRNYTCSFVLFEGNIVSKSIQLVVKASPEVSMPTVAPLVGVTNVTLATCCVDNGYPAASVSWNASSLGDTVSVLTTSVENQDGTLNITSDLVGLPTREINKKEVYCLVTHATFISISMSNYSINIEYPPLSAKVSLLSRGPPLTFQCEADANPQPDYTWTSNGVRSNGSKLILPTSPPDMNDLHHCEVSNKYGSATAALHLYPANSSGTPRNSVASWFAVMLVVLIPSIYLCMRKKASKMSFFRRERQEEPVRELTEMMASAASEPEARLRESEEVSTPIQEERHAMAVMHSAKLEDTRLFEDT